MRKAAMLAFIPVILTALTWGIAYAGSVKWMAVGSETQFAETSKKYWTPIGDHLSETVENLHIPLHELFICDSRFVFSCPDDSSDTPDAMMLAGVVDEERFTLGSVAEIGADGSFIRWVEDRLVVINEPDRPLTGRKQFVFLFPTRPTSLVFHVRVTGNIISCGFATDIAGDNPWNADITYEKGRSLCGSYNISNRFADVTFDVDIDDVTEHSFTPLANLFEANNDTWTGEMGNIKGFYALYLWFSGPSGSSSNRISFTSDLTKSSWSSSGLSEKFGFVGALDGKYEIEQSTDGVGGVVMSGEIQVPVTLGRTNEQDICVGLRTIWDQEQGATRVMGFGNGNPAIITNGDGFPIVTVGGAARVSVFKTPTKRFGIPEGVDRALIVLQIDDATNPPTMSVAVYPYDYDHQTLGDGSADNPRCTIGNTADAYSSETYPRSFAQALNFNASTKFTGEMVNLGRSVNVNYPSPIVWSQLTINRVNAMDGLNLYPWVLDCSKANCGAPDTVEHFRPYGFSPDDVQTPFAYIGVDDWGLHATGGDVPPLASDAASSGGAVTDVAAPDDFGIPEDGVSRKLPGGNFIDEISTSVGIPYYFIWTLIGFGLAIVIIAVVQTFFNNILLSVVAGGVVLAVIATPTVGIGAIWVLLFYAVVAACVVIVGQRTSVGY
jgi:hypothetical protein